MITFFKNLVSTLFPSQKERSFRALILVRNRLETIVSNIKNKETISEEPTPPNVLSNSRNAHISAEKTFFKTGNSFQTLSTNAQKRSMFGGAAFKVSSYMEELSHLKDVRIAQKTVMNLKEELQGLSKQKRDIVRKQEELQEQLHEVQISKNNVDRASKQYHNFCQQELDLFPKERELRMQFKHIDGEEQFVFEKFTTALNDSYEKEKIHTNFLRTWSLTGTMVATMLSLILSLFTSYKHEKKYARLISEYYNTNEKVTKQLSTLSDAIVVKEQSSSWGWLYRWALPKRKN